MDVFKLLSRGASIQNKHKEQLQIFHNSAPKVITNTDFFSPSKPTPKAPKEPKPLESKVKTEQDAKQFRAYTKAKVKGEDVPLPMASFEDISLAINENLRNNLNKFGFETPTAIQSEAIPCLLRDRDLLACAPTGSGKTLAFVVPMLEKIAQSNSKKLQTLVVTPTRELSTQIYQVACELAPKNVVVAQMNKKMLAKLRNSNAGRKAQMQFLVATPMRLIEAVKNQLVDLASVNLLVLDESDRLLGEGFVEQTDEIIAECTNASLKKAIFSATMPANVEELANSIMHSPIRIIIGLKEAASENIEQKLVFCGNEQGKLTGIRQMLKDGQVVPPILVFVQSIQRAKALFHELIYDKISVDVIHSDLTQNQRDRAINSFKNGDVWVLICTDVLSRGIDFHGVNLVINYDIPLNAQSYVHRIGRTGRAGRQGKAVTFYTKQDVDSVYTIANVMRASGCDLPDWISSHGRKRKTPIARDTISTIPKRAKRASKKQQKQT